MPAYEELLTLLGQNAGQRRMRAMAGDPYESVRSAPAYRPSPASRSRDQSWIGRPGALRDFAGERDKDAAFIAKYGMSPQDIMSGYRMSKEKEGEITPGGPATLRTGTNIPGLEPQVESPVPAGLSVGQRYDAKGNLITSTAPETTKFSGKDKRLLGMYKSFQERISQPEGASEVDKQRADYYRAMAEKARRKDSTGGKDEVDILIKLRDSYIKELSTADTDRTAAIQGQLDQVNAKISELKGFRQQEPGEVKEKAPFWERFLNAIKPTQKTIIRPGPAPWGATGFQGQSGLAAKNAWRAQNNLPPLKR